MLSECERGYTISCLPKLIARHTCKIDKHAHKLPHACFKHQATLFNCKLCEERSAWQSFIYQCQKCKYYFCVWHFVDHILLFDYCRSNNVLIDCSSDRMIEGLDKIKISLVHRIALNIKSPIINYSVVIGRKRIATCLAFIRALNRSAVKFHSCRRSKGNRRRTEVK